MKQPKVKYRAKGFDGDISEDEYTRMKKEGLEVFELKPFLVEGEEEYLSEDESKRMSEQFKVEPYKEAPASVSANLAKANKQSKAELWNENRNLSDFKYDKGAVPKPVNDDYFGALEDTRIGRYTEVPSGRGEYQESYARETDAVEKEYQKQKAIREGRYPYTQLDDEQELKNRNLFYVDKLYSDTSLRLSGDQVKELNDIDAEIKQNESDYLKAAKAGDLDATMDYWSSINKLENTKTKLRSKYEPVEKAVEYVERNTGSSFLTDGEYDMAMKIQGLDDLYEKKLTNDAPELDEMIGEVEEGLAKDFEKIFDGIDGEVAERSGVKSTIQNELEFLQKEKLRIGDSNPALDQKITEATLRMEDVDSQIATLNQKKEFFINPEKAASDALGSVAYSGESIPGKNAQEKARMLYSITAMQFEDGMKARFPEEFKTGIPSFSEFASKWKWVSGSSGNTDISEEDGKLQELYSTLEALAPIAMLNRAPSLNKDTAWDVFKKTFIATQVPFNEGGTDQEIAQKAIQSLAMISQSPDDFNKSQTDELLDLSSPYDHFGGKDLSSMTATTFGAMGDIVLAEIVTGGIGGVLGVSGKSLGALSSLSKARRLDLGEAWIAGLAKPKQNVISKALWEGLEEGARFEKAGLMGGDDGELNFLSGFVGASFASPIRSLVASKAIKKEGYMQVSSLFGSKTPEAIKAIKNYGGALRLSGNLAARPIGETVEEFGNEIGNIYRESSSFEEVKKQWNNRFGNMSDVMHFTLSSALMGLAFGAPSSIKSVMSTESKYWYKQLTDEEKVNFGSFLTELNSEWEYAADEARAVQEGAKKDESGTAPKGEGPANEPVAKQEPVGDTAVEGEQQPVKEDGAVEGGIEGEAVEDKKADIERRRGEKSKTLDENDNKSIEAIMPNNPNHPTMYVGLRYSTGLKATVQDMEDNRTKPGEGYQAIIAVLSPAEFDSNGKMTKGATVKVGVFDSKEQAEKAIQDKFELVKSKVGKRQKEVNKEFDAELAALESTTQTNEVETVEDGAVEGGIEGEAVEDGKTSTTVVEDLGITEDVGEVLEGGKKGKIGDTEVIITENDNELILESIKTEKGKTGKGSARKAMQKLTDSADKMGKPIRLRAVPENEKTSQKGLEKLYSSFGFIQDGDEMVRQPGATELDSYIEEVASTQSEEKVAKTKAEKKTEVDEVQYEGDGFTVKDDIFYDKKGKPYKRVPKKMRMEYFNNVTLREDPEGIEQRLQLIQVESDSVNTETWQNDVIGQRFRTKDVDDYFGKGRDNLKLRISSDKGIAVEDWIDRYNMDPNTNVDITGHDVFEFLADQDKSSAGMTLDPKRKAFIEDFGFDALTNEKSIFDAIVKISQESEAISKEELNELAEHDAKTAEEYEAYVNRELNNKSKANTDSKSPQGTTEQILDFLDDIESRLDKFGDESLSMGPAIVAGKIAIKAVRVAVKSGKSIAEAIEVGITALRNTDWYNTLSSNEKTKADSDVSRLVNGDTSNNVFSPNGQAIVIKKTNELIEQEQMRGRLLDEKQSEELQEEIESNYTTGIGVNLLEGMDDIRQRPYNYNHPYVKKSFNGVDLRIAQGLRRRNKDGKIEETYLLYADGKVVGEFYSVADAKQVVKFIEDNLLETESIGAVVGEGSSEKKTGGLLEFLDDIESRLDTFGSESLSMGPAIVAGKVVIQAVRVAVKAGKSIAEAIQAGVAALRNTDWYKAMTADEKTKAEGDVSRLINGDTSNNVFVPDSKAKGNPAQKGSGAEQVLGGMNKVSSIKGEPGVYKVKKNNVTLKMKDRPDGSVEIVDVRVPAKMRREGRAMKVVQQAIRLAHAQGIDVYIDKAIGFDGVIPPKGISKFIKDAGFQSSPKSLSLYYAPADGGVSSSEQNIQQALFNLWNDKITSGVTLEELIEEIGRSNWDERTGLTKKNLENLLTNMYNRYNPVKNKESKAKERVRGLYERILGTDQLTEQEKDAILKNNDLTYEILKNEKVNKLADEIFQELMDGSSSVEEAYRGYRAAYAKMSADFMDTSDTARSVHTQVLTRLKQAAIEADQNDLYAEIAHFMAITGTSLGRGIQQLNQASSPFAFKDRQTSIIFEDRANAIGEDSEKLRELAVELRKLQKELFNSDLDIERVIAEIAAKDSRIADLLKKLENAETQQAKASTQASADRKGMRSTPNRSAQAAKKFADKLDQFADDLDNITFSSIIPIPVLKAAIKAAAATLRLTGNTIQAVDDAIKALKDAPEYQNLDTQDQANARADVMDILKKNVDGLDKDLEKVSKTWLTKPGKKKPSKKKKETTLAELVTDHLSGNTNSKEDLASKIAAESGLTDIDAINDLAQAILEAIKEKVSAKILEKIESKYDKANKSFNKRKNQTAQELTKDIMNGALSDHNVMNAFSEYYGFTKITPEIIQKLNQFADVVNKLRDVKDNVAAAVVIEEMKKFMRENTSHRSLWASVAQDFMITATLSGVGTQTNAFVGGLSELIPGMVAETLRHINKPVAIAKSIANVFTSGAFTRAVKMGIAAGRKNQNDVAIAGTYIDLKTGNKFTDGALNQFIVDGVRKNKGLTNKLLSASLFGMRINFLLGAYDAFKNTTAKEYLEYLDEWSKVTGQANFTPIQRMKPSNIKAIQELVEKNMLPQDQEGFEERLNESVEEGKAMMEKLGIEPPIYYRARRKQEMINDYREQMEVQEHMSTVKEMMLMSTPKGMIGARAYRAARQLNIDENTSAWAWPFKLFGTANFLFPRIAIKSIGRVGDAMPIVGLAPYIHRAITGKQTVYKDGKVQRVAMTPSEKRRMISSVMIRQALFTAVYAAIVTNMFIFEDDDDEEEYRDDITGKLFGAKKSGPTFLGYRLRLDPNRLVDITGDMSDFRLDEATAGDNYAPMMLRFRTSPEGEWNNVVKTQYMVSMLPMFHMLGTWRDEMTYKPEEDWKDRGMFDVYEHAALSMGELSFNQMFRDVKTVQQAEEGNLWTEVGALAVERPLTAMLPNIYRDMTQAILAETDQVRKVSASNSSLAKPWTKYWITQWAMDDVPMVDSYGFSMPYENRLSKAPLFSMYVDPYYEKHAKGKVQYEMFLARPNIIDRKITKGNFQELSMYDAQRKSHGKARKYTDEERTALVMASRRLYGTLLEKYSKELKGMTDDGFQKATSKLRSKATSEASITYSHIVSQSKGAKEDLIEELINKPIFKAPNN
jgi:hypothetical protein